MATYLDTISRAEELQSLVDAEIRQLRTLINQLREKRNTLAPDPIPFSPIQVLTKVFLCITCAPYQRPRFPRGINLPPIMLRPSSTSREIDAEIVKTKEQIRQLKEKRNSFALIAIIPVEILTSIFLHLIGVSDTIEWITVSHVYRYWRRVALDNPSLWSRIPAQLPVDAVRTWLERSKHLPIDFDDRPINFKDLRVNYDEESLVSCYEPGKNIDLILTGNTERIRTLKFAQSFPDQGVQLFKSSMPALEYLRFRPFYVNFDIPTEWLQSYANQLRSLTLYFCRFNWNVLLLDARRLTRLCIFEPATLPNPDGLVGLLRAIGDQLEVLELASVFSSEKSTSLETLSSSTSRFSLPSLKSFYIKGPYVAPEIAFISLIESYGEASVNLELPTSATYFGPQAVENHCDRRTMLTIVDFLASRRPPFQFKCIELESGTHGVYLVSYHVSLTVSIGGLHVDTSWVADMGRLALSDLEVIDIEREYSCHPHEARISALDLFLLLSRLDKLSMVRLGSETARSFLDHFALNGHSMDPISFPKLKCLDIMTDLVDFDATAFQHVLEVRKGNGCPLPVLKFSGCKNPPLDLKSRLLGLIDSYE